MSRTVILFVSVFLLAGLFTVSGSPEIEPIEPSKEVGDVVALEPVVPGTGEKPKDDVEIAKGPAESKLEKVSLYFGASGSFVHGCIATLSVILVSELGDKTFFIAAIMAMRHARLTVFTGAMLALGLMHVMSAFFGYATTVIPRVYTYYISSFLFAVFGLKMLKEGWHMSPNEGQEEFEEVQEDLKRKEEADPEAPNGDKKRKVSGGPVGFLRGTVLLLFSKVFLQALTMTFLAEWGDRSQLATIVLAAREDLSAVILAGLLGHFLCTGLAVLGGRMIAQRISVRTVTLVGGVVFIFFAATALFMDPEEGVSSE